jgi:hypothetical protein
MKTLYDLFAPTLTRWNTASVWVILLSLITTIVTAQDLPIVPDAAPTVPNLTYNAHEISIELAPTVSSPVLFGNRTPHTFGYSFQTVCWQTASTGTGLEFGMYDFHEWQYGSLDHIAITESFRIAPFNNSTIFKRVAFELTTGAETFFVDGSKDLEFGPQIDVQITKKSRVEVDLVQHFRTTPSKDGGTIRVGWQLIF